ncbi:hypothetical protein ACSBR2_032319 [Camellia fascicularis]
MARKLMNAVQYDSYGGGVAGLKFQGHLRYQQQKPWAYPSLLLQLMLPLPNLQGSSLMEQAQKKNSDHGCLWWCRSLYAVQLAKLGNTHVTATCGARNLNFVKSLGADEVIDYKTPEGQALKSPSGKKYDVVVHCARDFPWSTFEPSLSTNGKVIDLTLSPSTIMTFVVQKLTFSKKQLVPLYLLPKVENLEYVVKLVKEGKLKTVIDSKYPVNLKT